MAVLPTGLSGNLPEIKGNNFFSPALFATNSPEQLNMRRFLAFEQDAGTRVPAQLRNDYGIAYREPVSPGEYAPGNIKKSTESVGVAGYNHRGNIPVTGSADDLSQRELGIYMQQLSPDSRGALRLALGTNFRQNFLNRVASGGDAYPLRSSNTFANLMTLATKFKPASA